MLPIVLFLELYVSQLLVKDYLKTVEKSIHGNEQTQWTMNHLEDLREEYKKAGQESIFMSDLQNVLSDPNRKMSLPTTLAQQMEGFLYVQTAQNLIT